MGTQRTSNKDVLEAVNELTGTIATLVATMTAQQQAKPAAPQPASTTVEASTESVKIPKDYAAKMEPKFQQFANRIGEAVVSFAYRKQNGKVGLWSVPKGKLDAVAKRRGANYLGAVAEYNPS